MSVVDAPPGLDFAGPAAGEFRARARPRRLARIVFFLCLIDGAVTYVLAARQLFASSTTLLLTGPLICVSIAAVGLAVRNASVRIDTGGVHWGWGSLGFRMSRARIKSIRYYDSVLAIHAKRGSVWYLSKYDWDRFEDFPKALKAAGQGVEHMSKATPIRARFQGYGVFLDALLVIALVASAMLLFAAVIR